MKIKLKKRQFNSRYAITFGETAILHVGGKEFGSKTHKNGFSVDDLKLISTKLNNYSEYISLSDSLPKELQKDNDAGVLIIRCNNNPSDNALSVSRFFADKLYREQKLNVVYDDKYWDNRRSKTLNKRARKNIIFGNTEIQHSDDYTQPSIKSFSKLPFLMKIKNILQDTLGEKASDLQAEGNHYHHTTSGIGYHGDSERKIVICLSLGKSSLIRFNWRMPHSSNHESKPIDIKLNHGDIYIMSEKATGYDWKQRSKVRVVHAAGHMKYIDK
tara:strand:+ start:1831 stop:2646 length:816 start_codon:yes stop_codon:yes gene_type:complete